MIAGINKPRMVIDKTICLKNIKKMAEKAHRHGLIFRPHFKTHQSAEVGNWFRDFGVESITVSSVTMASYFAKHSWKDILVAFPVNILELDDINRLASEIKLSLLLESEETFKFLSNKLQHPCNFYIKIDTGYHRTGLDASNTKIISSILFKSQHDPMLSFKGFLVHSGNTYDAKSKQEIGQIHLQSIRKLQALKEEFIHAFPGLLLSIGDTPSCSIMEDFSGIDEIRPGNFVFYDVMQNELGSCHPDEIASAVLCPVVAKHMERNEIVIYGGAVHLSKDFVLNSKGEAMYGLISLLFKNNSWSRPLEETFIRKLSQEHGIIRTNKETYDRIHIGNLLAVLPVHSCLVSDLLIRQSIIWD
ncbi:MAG: alanine racemase [Bacteroidales bacterium]|nr:alanine racemase [Bacteroidales bacterium]